VKTKDLGIKERDEVAMMVTIESRSPGLLTNAVPEAVKENLLLASEGRKPEALPSRSREEQFEEALYRLSEPMGDSEYGMKTDAFKQAMKRAAMSLKKLGAASTKKLDGTQVESTIFVGYGPDDLVPILGKAEARHDLITTQSGGKNAVTRAWFREWAAVLPVRFDAVLNREVVLQLLSDAGQCVGVGAWRRENGGHFGLWRITDWQ